MPLAPITYEPIGVYRQDSHAQKAEVPRQGVLAIGEGCIELEPRTGIEHALTDLELWTRIWLVFHFHQASGFRPMVWPPRSPRKRGLFATRSPHRPNAIGMSAVRLIAVEPDTRRVRVAEADLLDGTPILDLKPYVAYADAFAEAGDGWLAAPDPLPDWSVQFTPDCEAALAWLAARGHDVRAALVRALQLGPTPQPYRRIRPREDHLEIAVKEWRAAFRADERGRTLLVHAIRSGYRPAEREKDPALTLHRDFSAAFP